MGKNKQHFQHSMLYYFKKEKTQLKCKKICAVHREGAVTDRMSQKWFVKFRAGDFLLDEAAQLGRPVEVIVIKSRHQLRTINAKPHGK